MNSFIKWLGITAIITVTSFAMLGCASGPSPQQKRIEMLERINYKEIPFDQLKSSIASITTDGQGFKVTANVYQVNWYSFIIIGDKTPGSDRMELGAGVKNIREQLESDRQYTVYIAVLKENFFGESSEKYNGIVTRIDGLRSAEEIAVAREEARRQAELAKQEQERAEQARLANLYRQAGNNFGNFRNTSLRRSYSANALFIDTYDFGDGKFIFQTTVNGSLYTSITGTFRVNGDTVIFLSSKGEYSFGTILGNTLIIDGNVYR